MTLGDMATLICTKLNQNEAEDLAACQLFLTKRYEMIWNEALWKDSIIDWTYTLPTSPYVPTQSWLPTKQILLLPAAFERVLGVRTPTNKLNVQHMEVYYRADFDAFATQGMLVEYVVLPKAVWEFDIINAALLMTNTTPDANVPVTFDVLQGDGATLARDVVNATQGLSPPVYIDTVGRIDGIQKGVTQGAFNFTTGFYFTSSTTTSGSHIYAFYSAANVLLGTVTLTPGQSAFIPPTPSYLIVDGHTQVNLPGGAQLAVIYDAGGGGYNLGASLVGQIFLTLPASSAAATRINRIRLIGVPDPATTIRVLGKGKPNTFSSPTDSTMLSGVDNCLIAIGQYDMIQRERQYGKAQLHLNEYNLLLDQLKRVETVQQAHNQRIVPEDGYGNPYDLWTHPPLTF